MSLFTRNFTEKIKLANGKNVHVPKCITTFQPWRGKGVKYTYGGKGVLAFRGNPLFAELVVLAILKREGRNGVWVDSFRRKYRVGMFHLKETIALPAAQEEFLNKIRERVGCRGGCRDVFAWCGKKYRFIELKRHRKDHIRETPTNPGRGGEAVLKDTLQLATQLRDWARQEEIDVVGIGAGVADLVDGEGKVTSSCTIEWSGRPIREKLSEVAPAQVESDVRAAALGEAVLGAGRGSSLFVYIT